MPMARQAPGPTAQSPSSLPQPSPASGLSNGLLPHAGQQTDINYLWGIVQDLSDVLAQNRVQTAGLVEQVRQMREAEHQRQQSQDRGSGPENGDATHPSQPQSIAEVGQVNGEDFHGAQPRTTSEATVEISSLRSQLHAAQTQVLVLTEELHSQAALNDEYVVFLHGIMQKLRGYAVSHSSTLLAVHAHYNRALEEERNANLQLRIEHGDWQQSLGRMTDWARKALKERADETDGSERRIREVNAENRILRKLVGWQVSPEDNDSEDDEREGMTAGSDVSSSADGARGRNVPKGMTQGQTIAASTQGLAAAECDRQDTG
ncbi:MAG: hypothetical protein Q9162_005947 [Coniocarpon cinnabarinum]